MPRQVFSAAEVEELVRAGAQLVDVLGAKEFSRDHIPGAVNLPLKTINPASVATLDRERPVLVYCNDYS